MPYRIRLLVAAILFAPLPVGGQVADTIYRKAPLLTRREVVLGAGFIAATIAISPFDRYFARQLQDSSIQQNRLLRRGATGFRLAGSPGALVAGGGLYLIGRATSHTRTADLGLHSAEAVLIGGVIGGGVKAVVGRARPYVNISDPHNFQPGRGFKSDDYRSFPSGHAINAFAFASTVSRETEMWWPRSRWYIGSVMYGGATLVGMSRMYNNQHWASDVIGGAAIGTLTGLTVVRYQHSHPGNRIDRALLSVSITPGLDGAKRVSLNF